jgi:outer membrane protein OmpA-like peptidoglycan-associated protein
MSINLNQLVQGALTESVLQQLAERVGCAPESAKRVVSLCGPALIGSMMNKASSLDGARALFSAIMAPSTNARIADELPHFVVQDDGFKTLVEAGEKADGVLASHDSLNLLAERMAEYTGVAASASRSITGVVGATVLGVLKRYFTQNDGHVGQLPTLLGHQLPVVRANMTDAFAHALGLGSVGAFLAGVASRLKAVSAHLEHPATHQATAFPLNTDAPVAVPEPEAKDKNNKKAWMWVASAAALALFAALAARGCSHEKTGADASAEAQADASTAASGADAASAAMPAIASSPELAASMPTLLPSKDSVLNAVVDASGVPIITATVNTDAERQALITALSSKLGSDRFHANIAVDPDTRTAAWLAKIDTLLPVMSQPGAELHIVGDKLEIGGTATDTRFHWLDKLKAKFGNGWTVDEIRANVPEPDPLPAKQATPDAAPAPVAAAPLAVAPKADTPADDERCTATNIAQKLNLKPINFRLGSIEPQPASIASLSSAARTLKDCDTKVTPIKLEIGGYSDNTGSKALNLSLSKKRAESVRSYLVKRGVPATTLTVAAFGDARPIADNATIAGRQANRRVEFKAGR